MSRRMSCSMTVDAVRDRTKTVTRRHVDSWTTLKPGDRLTLIEKGMGLKKGERQVVLAVVEVVAVNVEQIGRIYNEGDAGTAAEGLRHMTCAEFVRFWMTSHGYPTGRFGDDMRTLCRRIEWRYLNEVAS